MFKGYIKIMNYFITENKTYLKCLHFTVMHITISKKYIKPWRNY